MPAEKQAAADVPTSVSRYVAVISAIATMGVAFSISALVANASTLAPYILPAIAVTALLALLHNNPFTFYWREHRLVVSMDETVLLIGLLVLPPPLVVICTTIATAGLHLWRGPAQRIKRVFNVVQCALAALISAGTYVLLTQAGVPALAAASAASFGFAISVNLLLSGVFSLMSRVSVVKVFRERFLVQGSATAVVGVSGGLILVALWTLHPLATMAALPFAYLVRRYWKLHAVADRELEVHRRLANVTHDLVGTSSVPSVADRVLSECEALLDPGRALLVVNTPEDALTLSRNFGSGPQRLAPSLYEPLPAHGGGTLGHIEVWPRQGKEPFHEQERALLRTIAGQAASAMENARAIQVADAARQRLDTYLATAPDAVLLVSLDGGIQYMNPAARALFVGDDDPRGLRASDLFDDPRLAVQKGHLPEEPQLVESSARTRAGDRTFLVEAHVGPLPEAGRVSGLLMVVRDITERKRLEDEMTRQREALTQNEKLSALGTLVAGVAHEINNPLTYMRGNLQLMAESIGFRLEDASITDAERALFDEIAEGVQVSLEGVDRIRGIASSLKNVAKKGTGNAREEDVNELVHEVLDVVRTGIPRSVKLELDLAADLPRVTVKASEIHQILLNLVKNAAEALEGRSDGVVRLRSWHTEDAVHLEVADNGVGIPAEVQRSLFSPFFTTKENGTGLGLSLSRGIAQQHGGELALTSEVGAGTSFVLTLPRRSPLVEGSEERDAVTAGEPLG